MGTDTINQAYTFLVFIVNGLLIGLLFDFFRILRKSFKTSDCITYLEDVLFWIFTGLLLLYFIFIFNNGVLRIYIFIAIAVGILIYMLLFSKAIINIFVNILNIVKILVKKFFTVIIYPLKILYKAIKKLIFKPILFVFINIKNFTSKKIYLCLKRTKNILFLRKKEGKKV